MVSHQKLDLPQKFKFIQHKDSIEITYRWIHFRYCGQAIFSIIWCFVLLKWYEDFPSQSHPLINLFLITYMAAGISMIYRALAGFLNKTHIIVDSDSITIKHKPIPFPGKRLNSREIETLYIKKKAGDGKNGLYRYYNLYASTQNRKEHKIFNKLPLYEQARYVKQKIAEYLNIPYKTAEEEEALIMDNPNQKGYEGS